MDTNATPSKRPNYSRPTKYPKSLALMLTKDQREAIEQIATDEGLTLGEAARALIDTGRIYYVSGN